MDQYGADILATTRRAEFAADAAAARLATATRERSAKQLPSVDGGVASTMSTYETPTTARAITRSAPNSKR